jgi:hypothetical protein
MMSMRLAGSLSQGEAIDTTSAGEFVPIPEDAASEGDLLFRASSYISDFSIDAGDYLIVDPRRDGDARTGELVLATLGGVAFVGRWWEKNGRRAIVRDQLSPVVEEPGITIFGAITVIVRQS